MPDMPGTVNLRAYRGDKWLQQFRFLIGDQPVDFSTATLTAEARSGKGTFALDVAPAQITGFLNLSLPALSLPWGTYDYDIEVTMNGETTTWVRGRLFIERDVTNELPIGGVLSALS